MKTSFNKKGKLSTVTVTSAIIMVIMLIVLFKAYSATIPVAQSAAQELNTTNRCIAAGCVQNASECYIASTNVTCGGDFKTVPLSGLFNPKGVVFIVIMIALLIAIIKAALPKGNK